MGVSVALSYAPLWQAQYDAQPTQAFFAQTEDRVNINEATAEELQVLPGIGETRAQSIVEYREANGPFASIDELIEVSGIGEKTLEELREYICV